MKKILLIIFLLFTFSSVSKLIAQNSPVWTREINSLPDSSYMFPVRTLNDANNNVLVLSTYKKTISPGVDTYKIYLRKFNAAGTIDWTVVYDNNGIGQPRGFDMVIDNIGNCYIAGGFMATQNFRPLLLKVSNGGSVLWQRDSTSEINTGTFDQIILNNNKLFLKAWSGIARFDLNGIEDWTTPLPAGRMAVDNSGQVIAAVYFGNPINIVRLDTSGAINFSAVSINAVRIATDADNSFYLLTDMPNYELVKFDSAGVFKWSKNNFPPHGGFGDIGFEVIVDNNNDVLLIGIAGFMYKFSSSGNLKWSKQIFDLDNYLIAAKITFSNLLAVAGTASGFGGYDLKTALFNLNGDEVWSGYYNSNNTQEFAVDLTIDNSGIYVIEDSISNTLLAKFASPFSSGTIDYNLICVTGVSYDSINPGLINVTVFNGNINHLNYPSVQIVSPAGDTISNVNNFVNFFAHGGNYYQTYTDTITVVGITDFSNYTFLISEGFGDTTVSIGWCAATAISEKTQNDFSIYPNPAFNFFIIKNNAFNKNYSIEIFSLQGNKVFASKLLNEPQNTIDVSGLASGLYFIRLYNNTTSHQFKLVKQ